ncbi:MAG: helix-turn-helix transcriptional regulator [Candidatus Pacebacteria bacterium]|nr:helix-turn-helix transcriptional regulator [Candidatus Paceibacterota bacterium]
MNSSFEFKKIRKECLMHLPTDKEVVVLQILCKSSKEMYGLEMVKEQPFQLRHSSIYVLLTRMVARGYLHARDETVEERLAPGPKKRLYEATEYGEAMLAVREVAFPLFTKAQKLKQKGTL